MDADAPVGLVELRPHPLVALGDPETLLEAAEKTPLGPPRAVDTVAVMRKTNTLPGTT